MDPIFLGILVVLFLVLAFNSVKIVRQFERLVVFRVGHVIGEKGPGPVWLWPFIDRAVRVDLRVQFLEVPSQTCITKDNAPIAVDFLLYWRVMSPTDSAVAVADFQGAVLGIAMTTLRAVVGDLPLDDVLARRDHINQVLQVKLDEVTSSWGVKVTAVEIREITPPRDIQDAMNRQMAAERTRRATVIEADGQKQAQVTVAEGQKESAILQAEGERQAAILRAEGFSLALQQVYNVAHNVDEQTLRLQYFDTLKALGSSPSTKFIFPLEFTGMLENLGRRMAGGGNGNGTDNGANDGRGGRTNGGNGNTP